MQKKKKKVMFFVFEIKQFSLNNLQAIVIGQFEVILHAPSWNKSNVILKVVV